MRANNRKENVIMKTSKGENNMLIKNLFLTLTIVLVGTSCNLDPNVNNQNAQSNAAATSDNDPKMSFAITPENEPNSKEIQNIKNRSVFE